MTPVIITGCAGKMGKALIERAKFQNIFLIGATEKKDSPLIGQNIGDVIVSSSLETLLTKKAVVIDFTDPKASLAHVYSCTEKKIPVVIGTTGFTETAKKYIEPVLLNSVRTDPDLKFFVMVQNFYLVLLLLLHYLNYICQKKPPRLFYGIDCSYRCLFLGININALPTSYKKEIKL